MSPRVDHSPARLSAVWNRVSRRYRPPAGMSCRTADHLWLSMVSALCQSKAAVTGAPVASHAKRTSTRPGVSLTQRPSKAIRPLPALSCCMICQSSGPLVRMAPICSSDMAFSPKKAIIGRQRVHARASWPGGHHIELIVHHLRQDASDHSLAFLTGHAWLIYSCSRLCPLPISPYQMR